MEISMLITVLAIIACIKAVHSIIQVFSEKGNLLWFVLDFVEIAVLCAALHYAGIFAFVVGIVAAVIAGIWILISFLQIVFGQESGVWKFLLSAPLTVLTIIALTKFVI